MKISYHQGCNSNSLNGLGDIVIVFLAFPGNYL